ncbi:MAG: protein kinase [Thermoleophilia bacterium]
MRLVPGESFGRYRVEAEVGRGGQAVVYRATQVDLDRQVALKVFDEGYLGRSGALERFRREAIAAGRLEHPRIVPVYDAGEVDGRAYITMRLIPGDTLAERIARTGAMGRDEAVAMLGDIADAIDFAHANGTVHRDVKPANILLDPSGEAYLSDFGLVRLDDMPGLTRRGDWLGTAEYVSPEQVEGEPATPRSDVYALAVVAFEALTGRAPYVRREPSAVLLAHVRDPVPRATRINPALPSAVDGALGRGLEKDPTARPTTARALVDEIVIALDEAPAAAPAVAAEPVPVAAAADDEESPAEERTPIRAAAAMAGGAWGAVLARFSDGAKQAPEPTGRVPERPTEAFGDAAKRRALAGRRDLLAVTGVAAALLLTGAGVTGWVVGGSQADASGAKAQGIAQGQEKGRQVGYEQGRAAGLKEGRRIGKREGLKQGTAQGKSAGEKAGYAKGKSEGYAQGVNQGRATALNGLGSGWWVVQIGSDGVGPVVSSSSPVTPDGGECFTVAGGGVFSAPCS